MMEPEVQEYCAEYICEMELDAFIFLENSEISEILDNKFDDSTANHYKTTLLALYIQPKNFSSEDAEDYCMAFLDPISPIQILVEPVQKISTKCF